MPHIMANNARKVGRAYMLSVGIWCGLSLLMGWQYWIFDRDVNIHSTLRDMILVAESRGLAYALLTPPVFYLVHRYLEKAKSSVWYVLRYALGAGPFLLLYACIRWAVLPPWDPARQGFVPRSASGPFELIRGGFADQITMYIAIVVAAHAYEYFRRVRKQEVERYQFQQALAASELQALKMQLHPHFLFNTLHGISTLIDGDGKTAKAMVIRLSSLLRTALRYSGSDLISLREELDFIREYLDLERMRFGERLTVIWSVAPDTLDIMVPQLILQPLVENAVRHGIASSRDLGWVEISSQRTGQCLELRIRNSAGAQRPAGTGVGLRNTEARLRHLYAEEASFLFTLAEDRTATAKLRFPALQLKSTSTDENQSSPKVRQIVPPAKRPFRVTNSSERSVS